MIGIAAESKRNLPLGPDMHGSRRDSVHNQFGRPTYASDRQTENVGAIHGRDSQGAVPTHG